MILDCYGRQLRRTAGFVTRYEAVREAQKLTSELWVVGFKVPLVEDEEEEDAARTRPEQARRAD